jgi:hypothetical protein
MRSTAHPAAGVALVLALLSSPAKAAVIDPPPTPLIIRLYGAPPFSVESGDRSVKEAHAILAEAGLAPEWIACAPAPPAADRCAVPLGSAEVAVRVIPASPPSASPARGKLPLGYALVDPQTKSGTLATVYVDRVRWLADASESDVAALLGRAIAHEIGHLLLGTNRHAPLGLMRAVWSRDAVRGGRAAEWRFQAGEARQMRSAVVARRAREQMARHLVRGE